MVVDYEREFRRLTHFLENRKFTHIDRVLADGSLRDLSVTNFLCVMEFLMNLVCSEQLNWKPVPILLEDGGYRMKITRENRDKILFHIMKWQEDLKIYPKLMKSQITNELNSWSLRRGDLLISAMDEMEKIFNNETVPSPSGKRTVRFSTSLIDSFTNGSFEESQEDSSFYSCSASTGSTSSVCF